MIPRHLQERDDDWLVERTLAGDNRAFRVLVERHHRLVYAVVRGVLGDHPDAEETVQNVIIRIHRGLPRFLGRARFTSWLYRIAYNEAVGIARRKRPPLVPLDAVPDPGHRRDDPESAYWRGVEARRLEAAMAQLDETQRIVMELRYMGERTYAEIAAILDLPLGTVKTCLHRAKRELKTALTRAELKAAV